MKDGEIFPLNFNKLCLSLFLSLSLLAFPLTRSWSHLPPSLTLSLEHRMESFPRERIEA